MSKAEAHTLLNAAKLGYPVSRHKVILALCATGDLTAWRAAQMQKLEAKS